MQPRTTAHGFYPRAAAACAVSTSELTARFEDAYYSDCFTRRFAPKRFSSALAAYLAATGAAPAWVSRLLAVRDRLVRGLGMTPTHGFGAHRSPIETLAVGAKLDFFRVVRCDTDLLLLVLDDRHFQVMIEVHTVAHQDSQSVYISAIVNPHTWQGRAYLHLIAPFHRRVVRSLLNGVN